MRETVRGVYKVGSASTPKGVTHKTHKEKQMADYQYCNKSKIRVGSREFNSVDGLIQSGYTNGKVKELLSSYIYWWRELTVVFPDKEISSSAFVECIHKQVAVGYPACYYTYNFPTVRKALTFAEYVNNCWLEFPGDWKEFLNSKLDEFITEFTQDIVVEVE